MNARIRSAGAPAGSCRRAGRPLSRAARLVILVCLGTALAALPARRAAALVDLTGVFSMTSFPIFCTFEILQTGTDIDISQSCFFGPGGFATGTIDPVTGAFSATGECSYPSEGFSLTISGTGSPDSQTIDLTTVCNDPMWGIMGITVERTFVFCGNGVLNAAEDCDDSNTSDGDCCSSTCKTPTGCQTGFARGRLVVKETVPGKEKLTAKFLRGPSLAQTDFGVPLGLPLGTTAYHLCILNGDGALVAELEIDRAGDTCSAGTVPCWESIGPLPPNGFGYRYKDKDTAADGVFKALLKSRGAGRSRALVKAKNNSAKGLNFLPTGIAAGLFAASSAATIQLVSDDTQCLQVDLTDVKKAAPDFFKAK